MCYVCCKEFKGWCKSFTRTELVLSLLQALLLVVLIGFLAFLTLHLLVCSDDQPNEQTKKIDHEISSPEQKATSEQPSTRLPAIIAPSTISPIITSASTTTLSSDIECTWQPSQKTKATTHYYWTPQDTYTSQTESVRVPELKQPKQTDSNFEDPFDIYDDNEYEGNSDGDEAPQRYKNYVAALVKLKPPADVTYGCILTKVTRFWTLTAASCIESIEEVDSLDSFFITETYGEVKQGLSHALADVRIHPLYQGANRSYDLAALRSGDALATSTANLLKLATMLDYFLVAIGERFTILGYGGYRTIDKSATGRRLRQVSAFSVSMAQCGDGADVWAPRHLARGGALLAGACAGGACGAAALCAGALYSRGTPCAYCAGTPLLRAGRLLGLMGDNRQCGIACEPTLYVNVAALRDWIESVVD